MTQVGRSGAEIFRVPLAPKGENDGVVTAAARNGVTINANIGGNEPLPPMGVERTAFINGVSNLVQRYGYGGQFWAENPGLPYKPVTTWEIWNEPNDLNIGPVEFGIFLNEVASAVQSASYARAGRSTEVLSGGLLVLGNRGGTKGNWFQRGPDTYNGALAYLREAYPYFGGIGSSVTGVAIHPYELDPSKFQTGYRRMQAFEYAVSGFHNQLTALPESPGSPELSLAISESGWPAEGQWSVGPTEQANLLKGAVDYSRSHAASLNLTAFYWYNLRDAGDGENWQARCGLRSRGGSYRPAWYTFQDETGVERTGTQYTAFQANNKELWWTRSDGFYAPTKLGMESSSSPSAVALPGRGDLIAFQDWQHALWTFSTVSGGWNNTGFGMDPGTSPSVAYVPGGGVVIAFQDWQHHLWVYSTQSGSWINTELGMLKGTSPSIAASETGGYEVAFQANNNELWYYRSDGFYAPTKLGMQPGTSPSIAALPGGGYDFAFQDWQHNLWTYSTPSGSGGNQGLGMQPGTSPSIAVKPDGSWEIAFQANNGELWFDRSDGFYAPTKLGMEAKSSPSIAVSPEGNYSIAFQDWQHNLWTYSSVTGAGTNLELGMEAGSSPSTTIR
ncbi:MAG TPA: hypothetical protein VJL81_14355 [Solirubrobacterales bacterium]|nr:hypothetical protein [Solirubrobacterales bacterium]